MMSPPCAGQEEFDPSQLPTLFSLWSTSCAAASALTPPSSGPMASHETMASQESMSSSQGRITSSQGSVTSSNITVADVEAGLLGCLQLLSRLISTASQITNASCQIIKNPLTRLFLPGNTSAELSRACAYPLTSLVTMATQQTCFGIFLADATSTFAKLQALDMELRKTMVTLTSSMTSSQSSVLTQSIWITCYALHNPMTTSNDHPINSGGRVTKLCNSSCHAVRNVATMLFLFVSRDRTPTLSLLTSAAMENCASAQSLETECLEISQNSSLRVRSSKNLPQFNFCFNLSCHFPLRATPETSHWEGTSQRELRSLYIAAKLLYPSAVLPYNGSILPCGLDCVSVTFYAGRRNHHTTHHGGFSARSP